MVRAAGHHFVLYQNGSCVTQTETDMYWKLETRLGVLLHLAFIFNFDAKLNI